MSEPRSNVRQIRKPTGRAEASLVVPGGADVRDLIPDGHHIARPVLFEDDVWDLSGHVSWTSKQGGDTKLKFDKVPALWRTAAKEWTLLCLDPGLAETWAPLDPLAQTWADFQETVKPVTAMANVKSLAAALRVLDRHGLHVPAEDDWARIARLMREPADHAEKRVRPALRDTTMRHRAQQLRSLWQARTIIGRPGLLGEEPFGGWPLASVFKTTDSKLNRTRPHEQVGMTLGFVAFCVDNIADDLLAHLEWWRRNSVAPGHGPSSRRDGQIAMAQLFDELLSTQGCLPATVDPSGGLRIPYTPLGLLLGIPDADEAYQCGRWAKARFKAAPLSLTGGNPCPLPISSVLAPDGERRQWTSRLLPASRSELGAWIRRLVYYCLYYLNATIGLRDQNIDALPLDCLIRQTKSDPGLPDIEISKIRGYRVKGRHAPQPTTWTVSPKPARVVEILRTINLLAGAPAPVHERTGEKRLVHSHMVLSGIDSRARSGMHLDASWFDAFRDGAAALRRAGVVDRDLSDISRMSSTAARITALQAWASRPLGEALAAHYGQWDHRTTALGYHGDVRKVIHLADPEDAVPQEAEARGRLLRKAYREREQLRGRGTRRLDRILLKEDPVLKHAGPLSAARLRKLGERNASVYNGPHTICAWNEETALCGGMGAPDFRLCQFYRCGNSSMTLADRARIEVRRRWEASASPATQRSARKLAEAVPEIVNEFAEHSDEELARIVLKDHQRDLDAIYEDGV